MNLEEFYDADERRRRSDEVEYGIGWSQAGDPHHSFDLFWVRDTGELYAMARPPVKEWRHFSEDANEAELDTSQMDVEILGVFADQAAVDAALSGWEDAVREHDSMGWARQQISLYT